jgi:SAM-dependent methyltransferase
VTAPAHPAAEGAAPDADAFRRSQLALFQASVLKQAKWRALSEAVGPTAGLDALDLGSDNGVISWLFRQRGGRWASADLTDETVAAIRAMVGENVYRLTGPALPFPDATFDRVVVVDLLEHLDDDRGLLAEIARCLRPGGRAVLNVPHRKRWGVLPPLRHALGLTDAWHGHRHAGYTRADLAAMLPAGLALRGARSYSRFFSHLLDTALNWAFLRKSGGRARSTAKGMVVTGHQVDAGGARALGRLYPAMRAFAALDALVPFTRGYMLLAELDRVSGG